jgi:tetraacyldisaccharide 4'-kinase
LTAEIARLLVELGERPSILSRGYGRLKPSEGVVVVSDGRTLRSDVAHAGDEPFMLARLVPDVSVVVCPSRYLAGRLAESQLGCTIHVLDDGFQHFQLHRDIDLLMAPPEDFQDTRTLPFGRLREPIESARVADALLVPLNGDVRPDAMSALLKVTPAFGFTRRIDPPARLLRGFAFAGIAKPAQFFRELEQAGWPIVGRAEFRDHHPYSQADIDTLKRKALNAGAEVLVTTSKDAVRFSDSQRTSLKDVPLVEVPLHISIDAAFGPWLRDRVVRARAA